MLFCHGLFTLAFSRRLPNDMRGSKALFTIAVYQLDTQRVMSYCDGVIVK